MWIRTSQATLVDTETGNNVINDERDGGKALLFTTKGKEVELLFLGSTTDSTKLVNNIYRQVRQTLSETEGGLDQFELSARSN